MFSEPHKPANTMDPNTLKQRVGQAALDYIQPDSILGVGTGSTVNKLIEALGQAAIPLRGAVSSSEATSALLRKIGVAVLAAEEVDGLDVYIDGADEIDASGCMIKGGGAALTREKIVADLARQFVCIADISKQVEVLGSFPLPVEVIPMAAAQLARRFAAMGAQARLRRQADGQPLRTDNGQHILDVTGLHIDEPLRLELEISAWPGVVTVGIFARNKASVCLLGGPDGVATLHFS